jgi:hypothetical protein
MLNANLMSLVKDSILISTNISNPKEVVFDIISKEEEDWSRYYLYVRNLDNFYYQRYETSMQRSGLANLRRIQLQKDQHEWINELKDWQNIFTKEKGIEFQLYNGALMRFVGSNLDVEKSFVEGPLEDITGYGKDKPNHIETSTVKLIVNESVTSIPTLKETELAIQTDSDVSVSLDESGETKATEIDPVFEQALQKIDTLTDHPDDSLSDSIPVSNSEKVDEIEIPEEISIEDQKVETEISLAENNIQEIKQEASQKSSLLDQIEDYVSPIDQDNTGTKFSQSDEVDREIEHSNLEDISVVDGVNKAHIQQLNNLGFTNIEKLSNAKISQLIEIKGIGRATARKIIQSAKSLKELN